MSNGYQQVVGADGWHFVARGPDGAILVFPLAVWGLTGDGRVLGLVGDVPMGGIPGSLMGGTARLIPPPPISGAYRHRSTMTAAELAAIPTPEANS
jgi:hypothetical protein